MISLKYISGVDNGDICLMTTMKVKEEKTSILELAQYAEVIKHSPNIIQKMGILTRIGKGLMENGIAVNVMAGLKPLLHNKEKRMLIDSNTKARQLELKKYYGKEQGVVLGVLITYLTEAVKSHSFIILTISMRMIIPLLILLNYVQVVIERKQYGYPKSCNTVA